MRVFSFCILSGFTVYLFIQSSYEAFLESQYIAGVIILLMVAGMIFSFSVEAMRIRKSKVSYNKHSKQFFVFISVVVGGVLTYSVSAFLETGPVVSAGLIGILSAMFVKNYSVPLYCGAFVGMVCCQLFTLQMTIAASVIAGLVFVASEGVLDGYGGRLGTIAFIGAVVTVLSTKATFVPDELMYRDVLPVILAYSSAAAGITFFLSANKKHGPVLASGAVGMAGGIVLPAIHEAHGAMLAAVVICASFVGMSSVSKVKNSLHSALAGSVAGLVFSFSARITTGAGGKLGTIAFGTVLGFFGLEKLFGKLIKRPESSENNDSV